MCYPPCLRLPSLVEIDACSRLRWQKSKLFECMYVCMCYQVNFSMWFVKVPTIILRALKSSKDTLLRRWELDSNLVATRGLPLLWMDKSSEDVSSLNHCMCHCLRWQFITVRFISFTFERLRKRCHSSTAIKAPSPPVRQRKCG